MNYRELLAGRRRELSLLLALGLLQSLAAAAQVALTTWTVDRLAAGPRRVLPGLAALAAALALSAAAREWERLRAERLGHTLVAELRTRLFAQVLRLDLPQVERLGHGGLLLRLTGDLEALRRFVAQGLVRLPIQALTLAAALAALGYRSPLLAAGVGATLGLGAWASLALGPRLAQSLRAQRRTRARLAGEVNQRLQAVVSVRANAREARELARLEESSAELAELGARRAQASAGLRLIAALATGLGGALALGLGAFELSLGAATLGDVVASLTLLAWLSGPVQELSRAYDHWHGARLTREKLAEIFALAPAERPRLPSPADGRLRLEGARVEPLESVDIAVDPGGLLAVVGSNGSGKSRLLQAIAGLRAPSAGRVLFDGLDTAALSPGERRRLVGHADATPTVLSGSLSKNVRYRVRKPAAEQLERALDLAGLKPLIARLPEGLETRVGPGGVALSAGETARIGLARALLGDPPLLVLDEVDAHLDADSRARLLEHLKGYGGLALVASHSPAVLPYARQAWLLENGRLTPFTPPGKIPAALSR